MRSYDLKRQAREAFESLPSDARRAVALVIAEMLDERVPLVGPGDFSVTRGPQIMARPVLGTDLEVYCVPAGVHVFVVDVVRHPRG